MYVLSRRRGDRLILDTLQGPITIEVVEFRSGDSAVRLSVEAPEGVGLHRGEVWDARLSKDTDPTPPVLGGGA